MKEMLYNFFFNVHMQAWVHRNRAIFKVPVQLHYFEWSQEHQIFIHRLRESQNHLVLHVLLRERLSVRILDFASSCQLQLRSSVGEMYQKLKIRHNHVACFIRNMSYLHVTNARPYVDWPVTFQISKKQSVIISFLSTQKELNKLSNIAFKC